MLNPVSLGETLRTARRQNHLTQEEAAEIANVSVETIRNIEHGETVPLIHTVLVLWDIYSLPREKLWEYYSRSASTEKRLHQIRRAQSALRLPTGVGNGRG